VKKIAFTNGKVYTPQGIQEAILLEGDRIAYIGPSSNIRRGLDTEVIDLDRRAVLPGLCDSHAHFMGWASSMETLNLKDCVSIEDLRSRLRKHLEEKNPAPGEWVRARGWNNEQWSENRFPTRKDLDDVASETPLVISRGCGHIGVVNTKAMEVTGLTAETKIQRGLVDLGEDGEPNGILREMAVLWLYSHIPGPDSSEAVRLIRKFGPSAAAFGLTTVNTEDLSFFGGDYRTLIQFYMQAAQEGNLPFRAHLQLSLGTVEALTEFLASGWRTGMGLARVRIGPHKLICDGSLGGRTAFLRQDYADEAGRGAPIYMQEELNELVELSHSSGMQIAMHAIGDAALSMCLDAVERAQAAVPRVMRHLIVHCVMADDMQLARMKRLSMGAAIQPSFAASDHEMALRRLGRIWAEGSYRWKTMLRKGLILSGGSDAPVESLNPFAGIHAAVTRKNLEEKPEGGWTPAERLSMQEAISLYTWASAWHDHEENLRGDLSVGKKADLVVLNENPFLVKPHEIKAVKPIYTLCGGEFTYRID
jgi:predicted amidohydrolase YtcJ